MPDSAERPSEDEEAERLRRIIELAEILKSGDPDQLAFQISEIAGDRVYTRHGVSVGAGDVIVDVGGNYGVSAAHFALQCGVAAVHSFEPVPATFEVLRSNVGGIAACSIHPMGLGSADARRTITYFEGGDPVLSGVDVDPGEYREILAKVGQNLGLSETAAAEMVSDRCVPKTVESEFTTLSGFLSTERIDRVDLLKVDVEGAELEVFRGIAEADWPRIRQVAAEIHSEELLREVRELLTARGFELTDEQDPQLAGTPIRMLYAVR